MAINQFAKIAPLVNDTGYLYDTNGTVTDTKLKPQEIGIVKGTNDLITIIIDEENNEEKIVNFTNNGVTSIGIMNALYLKYSNSTETSSIGDKNLITNEYYIMRNTIKVNEINTDCILRLISGDSKDIIRELRLGTDIKQIDFINIFEYTNGIPYIKLGNYINDEFVELNSTPEYDIEIFIEFMVE